MYQSEDTKVDPAILEVFAKAADAAELSSVQPNPIGLGAFNSPSVYGPFIDTVKLKANIELSPEFIEKVYWCKQTSEYKSGDSNHNIWWVAKLEEEIGIKCEYRPSDYAGKPLFMAEFSIPKLLYGTNIYALPDLGDAYLRIQQIWDGMENLPPLTIWDTQLMKLHYGVNIPVEQNLIPYYLAALMKEKLPNRQTTEFRPKESVRYPSKSRTLQIYCKYRQTNLMKAQNILRIEDQLTKSTVGDIFGDQEPKLKNVTREKIFRETEHNFERLGILDKSFASRNSALETFVNKYGRTKGMKYYGYFCAYNDNPDRKTLAAELGITVSSLNKTLNKIENAGLSLSSQDYIEPLPPLPIRSQVDQQQKHKQLVMVNHGRLPKLVLAINKKPKNTKKLRPSIKCY